MKPENSHVIESLLPALVRSPGTALLESPYKKAVYSKTVTNKCRLLSVLVCRDS